jgi:hypothetical protein
MAMDAPKSVLFRIQQMVKQSYGGLPPSIWGKPYLSL